MSDRTPRSESELVEFVRSIDVRAPEELHRRVDALIAGSARRRRGRRRLAGMGLAAAAAAAVLVAIALAVGLSGGSSPSLTLHQAAALTLSPATAPAPAESTRGEDSLTAAVDGVSFPYWEDRFGWRATGARTDHIGGRAVTTVFYSDGRGRRIGYAIVAGTPAPAVRGGVVAWRDGRLYRLLVRNGVPVVTWLRDGRLCIVSGRGVDGATLLTLASWHEGGAVAS